jgi:hypothetical protein
VKRLIDSPMRTVAVEAVDEILVLVVDVEAAVAPVIVVRLLLAKSLHSVVHITRYGTASGVQVRSSLHLLWVHCDRVVWIHFLGEVFS